MAKAWLSRKIYGPSAETKNILWRTNVKATNYLQQVVAFLNATGNCLEAQYHLILTGFQNQEGIHHYTEASGTLAPETGFQ